MLVRGLPGDWPASTGPLRHELAWLTLEEAFDTSGEWWWREIDGSLAIRFLDEGEYRISGGSEPQVSTVLGPADEREAALSFVLAVLPLSLPLLGLEPFHGSALELPEGGALLVTGFPEAGKSTTAAALRARGFRFLADDACAIDEEGQLWPGPPLLSARSTREGDELFATYDGKSVIAIHDHDGTPRAVYATVVLRPEDGAQLRVQEVSGRDAITAVLEQVRSSWVMPERRREPQFHAAAELARHKVGLVSYSKGAHSPDVVAAAIAEWAEVPA